MGMLSEAANSAKGMFTDGAVTEKAIIYVLNPSCTTLTQSEIGDAANALSKTLRKSGPVIEKAAEATKTDMIKSAIGYGSKSSKRAIGQLASEDDEKRWIKVPVQYNPATIRLYSAIGRLQEFDKKENGIGRLNIINLTGKSKLSFDLVFDDCENIDAFMLENLTPNVSNVANKAGDMITHAGGEGHSVRRKMDAFLSLLSVFETQQVVFCWSKMVFRGTLTTVNNKYVMFNTKGNPVRGTMHLEITQEATTANTLKYEEKVWDDAFHARFTQASVGKRSIKNALSNSILNINY